MKIGTILSLAKENGRARIETKEWIVLLMTWTNQDLIKTMTTATGTVIEMSVAETEIWITDVGATTKIARDTVIENTVTDVVATVIVNEIAIGIETGTTEIATEIGMIGRMNGKMTATGTEIWIVGVDVTTKTETGTAVDMMWKGIAIETEGAGAGAERSGWLVLIFNYVFSVNGERPKLVNQHVQSYRIIELAGPVPTRLRHDE